jgi:hypothetical protein
MKILAKLAAVSRPIQILGGGSLLILIAMFGFSFFEPQLLRAIENQFTIKQTVTSEISFLTPASNVTMVGALAGVTGGTSNGSTQVVVYTNDSSGYTMTIKASSSPAMQGETQGGTIADYTPGTANVPDFAFSVPTGAEFGYTISASTTADLSQKFKDNGSVCNAGALDTTGATTCWYGLSTTATSTIVTTAATSASGSTSTIIFKLKINSGGSVTEDIYNATTTLTATTN